MHSGMCHYYYGMYVCMRDTSRKAESNSSITSTGLRYETRTSCATHPTYFLFPLPTYWSSKFVGRSLGSLGLCARLYRIQGWACQHLTGGDWSQRRGPSFGRVVPTVLSTSVSLWSKRFPDWSQYSIASISGAVKGHVCHFLERWASCKSRQHKHKGETSTLYPLLDSFFQPAHKTVL